MRKRQRVTDSLDRLPRFDGDAEFGVHLACAYRLICMRVYSRRNTKQHLLRPVLFLADSFNRVQLFNTVGNKAAYAKSNRFGNIGIRLGISVEINLLCRKTGGQRGVDFSEGDGVNAHSLFVHNTVNLLEGRRLARINRGSVLSEAVEKRFFIHTAVFAYFFLIHQVERRCVFSRQRLAVESGKLKPAVLVA